MTAKSTRADFAVALHTLSYLSARGRAAIPIGTAASRRIGLHPLSYVEAEDTREIIDVAKLNAEIAQTVTRISTLRREIDGIVKEQE